MFSTDNASFKAKNIRAGSPDLFMSMTKYDDKRGHELVVIITIMVLKIGSK